MNQQMHQGTRDASSELRPYDLFILGVGVLALLALILDTLVISHPEAERLLQQADTVACLIFFADFVYRFRTAPQRGYYLRTRGWLDLASSIPAVGGVRIGRVARIAHILRFVRGIREMRAIGQTFVRRRGGYALAATALVSLTTLLLGSVLILHAERAATAAHPANITTASDALWWAFVTITTVGYGDLYPVTDAGRATAVVLMVVGVGLFATMSGLFASWLLQHEKEEVHALALLRQDVRELQALLERKD